MEAIIICNLINILFASCRRDLANGELQQLLDGFHAVTRGFYNTNMMALHKVEFGNNGDGHPKQCNFEELGLAFMPSLRVLQFTDAVGPSASKGHVQIIVFLDVLPI